MLTMMIGKCKVKDGFYDLTSLKIDKYIYSSCNIDLKLNTVTIEYGGIMKQLIRSILISALMISLLTGCASENKGQIENTKEPISTDLPTESTLPQETTFQPGVRTATEYTSEWAGLTYSLTDDMIMLSDEEIIEMMKLGSESFLGEDENGNKVLDYALLNTVIEMAATKIGKTENISIMVEKLPFDGITEDIYVNVLLDNFTEAYDLEIEKYNITSRTVAGYEFKELTYSMVVSGINVNQTMLIRKIDDRILGITLTYSDQNGLDSLLANFSAN